MINFRVIVEYKYVGDFYMSHNKIHKRRMTNAVKKLYLREMIDEKKSSEFLREEEALHLMKQGKLNIKVIVLINSLFFSYYLSFN